MIAVPCARCLFDNNNLRAEIRRQEKRRRQSQPTSTRHIDVIKARLKECRDTGHAYGIPEAHR